MEAGTIEVLCPISLPFYWPPSQSAQSSLSLMMHNSETGSSRLKTIHLLIFQSYNNNTEKK